ncbi:hypothetical protein Lal_00033839 [Lupinus albus]|nr:hypothetical protein Lal_00033839 [Lupinus albus]
MVSIRAYEINKIIRERIEQYNTEAKIAMAGELVEFEECTIGIALNLESISTLGVSLERENCRLGERGSPGRVKSWAILKDSRLSENCLA